MTAEFEHPRDSMTSGRLHAQVQSNQVNLAQIRTLQKERPNTSGVLNLECRCYRKFGAGEEKTAMRKRSVYVRA